ncbi:spermidine synthase [Nocardioides sp. T5]|uniref:spermidine synthase n=1 Tax=Nocardioides sp. T5 TaxID=3400182 RepID=UPI003A865B63
MVSPETPTDVGTSAETSVETSAEVARAESPRGEVVLRRRTSGTGADVLELRVNGVFVMDTLETTSEIELAAQALDLVEQPATVLVGGLGLGFTLQRVLADPRVEQAVVVEIEEALIRWMRDGTVPHGPAVLADTRASVVNADIAMAIAEARSTYDLVLLDVDNGPGYLVHERNEAVYEEEFLRRCRDVLGPGGVLVVWSASAAPDLLTSLRTVFGSADEQAHDVLLQDRPEQYFLYLARR